MAKWTVKQTVEYWAEGIEAETEDEARELYLQDQEMHYHGVESETIVQEDDEDEEE